MAAGKFIIVIMKLSMIYRMNVVFVVRYVRKRKNSLIFLLSQFAMKQNSQPSKILTLSHEVQKRDYPPYELHRKNFHSTLPRCYRKKNVKEFFHCAEMMLIGPDE